MKLLDNWKNLVEKVRNLSHEQMSSYKTVMIILILADLFGVYWYLNQKKLGVIILMVILALFTFLLIEGPKAPPPKPIPKQNKKEVKPKMPEETENEKEEEVEEAPQDNSMGFNLDLDTTQMGLPSSEEMNKRLNDALGTF